jgi:uncharacterized peroxidase-related enzyme
MMSTNQEMQTLAVERSISTTPKGFAIHTIDSAPEQSGPALEQLRQKLGLVPNLYAVLAESPAVLHSVLAIGELIGRSDLFSMIEKQVIQLAVSYANGCVYCMAGHSASALRQGVAEEHVAALRQGSPLSDPRLEALRLFTAQMVEQRGQLSAEQEQAFHAAGFSRAQMLEVVLNVALKTLTNYADHLAETPVDQHFKQFAWNRP